jgi:iron(III) transport system permease protein
MIRNTLLYCGLAAGLDVLLGTCHRLPDLRTRLPRASGWTGWPPRAGHSRPGAGHRLPALFKGMNVPGTDVLMVAPGS